MTPNHKPFRIERDAPLDSAGAFTGLRGRPSGRGGRPPGAPGAAPLDPATIDAAAMRAALSAGAGMHRAADELAAIVNDTARAANTIIGASEEIDNLVLRLRATAGRDAGSDIADELAEHSLVIYQACGFQDLTGQRIANVVEVLREFEHKVTSLRRIWDGLADRRPPHPAPAAPEPRFQQTAQAGLENGPRLPADAGHLSQSEIDAIFE